MDVSLCLTSQPALSPGHFDYLHGQTAWRCTAAEHLAGKGAHIQPDDQAVNLPRPVLDDVKNTDSTA